MRKRKPRLLWRQKLTDGRGDAMPRCSCTQNCHQLRCHLCSCRIETDGTTWVNWSPLAQSIRCRTVLFAGDSAH